MARVAVSVSCTDQERRELERLSSSRTEEARLVERAKIVMGCLGGKRNDEIAAKLGVRPGTVGVWRQRFAAEGLTGLQDRKRPGRPRRGTRRPSCGIDCWRKLNNRHPPDG